MQMPQSNPPTPTSLQAILGEVPQFIDARWLPTFSLCALQTCRILKPSGDPLGTGGLVAPSLVVTANHVVEAFISTQGSESQPIAEFDFDGTGKNTRRCEFAANWLECGSPSGHLDYALVRLKDSPAEDRVAGIERQSLAIKTDGPAVGELVVIFQHPQGAPLIFSPGKITMLGGRPGGLAYSSDAERGSSGGPCVNHRGELVGLHLGAEPDAGVANRGVSMAAIMLDVANKKPRLLVEIKEPPKQVQKPDQQTPFAPPNDVPIDNLGGVTVTTWHATFVGRTKELAEARANLEQIGRAAITGPPGVGKSFLSLQYVRLHRHEYDMIWWLRGAGVGRLLEGYGELAGLLGLVDSTKADLTAVFQSFKTWLAKKRRWLLIVDAADEPSKIEPWLPNEGHGHILITSQFADWCKHPKGTELAPLALEESIAFIQKEMPTVSARAARTLATELGNMPLAILQAIAYIDRTGQSIPGYLRLWKTADRRVQDHAARLGNQRVTLPVASTGLVAIENLRDRSKAAIELLSLLSLYAPDPFSFGLLGLGKSAYPPNLQTIAADQAAFDIALGELRSLCLIGAQSGAFSIHTAVQNAVRASLSPDEEKGWATRAIESLLASFPSECDQPANWPVCQRLFPHAAAAARKARELNVAHGPAHKLCFNVASYFVLRGSFLAAKAMADRAMKAARAAHGVNSSEMAECHSLLGNILYQTDQITSALKHFDDSYKINVANMSIMKVPPATLARNMSDKAMVAEESGDLVLAKALYEGALEYHRRDGNQKGIVTAHLNVSRLLLSLQNVEDATYNLNQAIGIVRTKFEPKHALKAACYRQRAMISLKYKSAVEALRDAERARLIDRKIFDSDSTYLVDDYELIAHIHESLNDNASAAGSMKKSIEIRRRDLPFKRQSLWLALFQGSQYERKGGSRKQAEDYVSEALTVAEQVFGRKSKQYGHTLFECAKVYSSQGDIKRAEAMLAKAQSVLAPLGINVRMSSG